MFLIAVLEIQSRATRDAGPSTRRLCLEPRQRPVPVATKVREQMKPSYPRPRGLHAGSHPVVNVLARGIVRMPKEMELLGG